MLENNLLYNHPIFPSRFINVFISTKTMLKHVNICIACLIVIRKLNQDDYMLCSGGTRVAPDLNAQ